jgi:putative Ca2+/H+ antiporter (TMEM165/GDT1 family)
MDLTPLIASFTLFALMEFGDKTHITVIALSMKNKTRDVFIGATAAFALVDGASVLIGGAVANVLPTFWLKVGSGALFIILGVISLVKKEEEQGIKLTKNIFLSVFSLVALMELGDKTQFASIILAARYGSPILVFLGIVFASAIISGSGIILGHGVIRFLPQRYMKYITSSLFIFLGSLFLITAFLGIDIL